MGEKVVNKYSVGRRLVMGSQELTRDLLGNLPLLLRTSLTLTFKAFAVNKCTCINV